ncbi:MAG: ISAs1 family transposase [Planctomycetes bacterium]|nr:ISAs1 family transposase [Planctomycetota bacterium]
MTKLVDVGSVGAYFESLSDPRHTRNRKHLLTDIVIVAVCGVICGCDGPTAIHRWARLHVEWLKQHLPLPNGLPSRDCIRRLLMVLKPEAFQRCFQEWIADALPTDEGSRRKLIAIDGKTCRGSHDEAKGLGALHIVSAWASEEGIALGQVATEEKSNEITAIPLLLQQVDLSNAIVTIDAMGCQKEIVKQIADGGGDFVIGVKDNQPTLKAAIEAFFLKHLERDLEDLQYRHHETHDSSHGRLDERMYYVAKIPRDFALKADWPWVKAIGYSLRLTPQADGTEKSEVRYYICSRYLSGPRFGEAVRGHWAIESMHWVLDVNFREDDSRTRERTLGDNLSWLRRFAVTLFKRHPGKDSLRGKMISCGMSTAFLTEVLSLNRV